ncbi:PREDICTED: high mobility group B protein 2-like [Brassica oleracea var. oleracea]|uniref:high mobility group B protein 2-like n=1 Tax=Brassica oleracea var. oleracea TaxID=109376 RepID=UPI0006A71FFE|nr:PREDICTED: high mobility group B protein 2-like [Brassica oleracea var. oleracea]XP_013595260.1 PREDICTED: high mobility group B protein 2-like [Brassica oleracea var. oleracea]XP_013595262.1 PREDICTED: high mobility group B protein 2-like [Brassica oleracea var. oleracea]
MDFYFSQNSNCTRSSASDIPAKSIMKVAKSQTETRSSKLSLNKMPAKVGKPAATDPKKPKRPGGLPPDLQEGTSQ